MKDRPARGGFVGMHLNRLPPNFRGALALSVLLTVTSATRADVTATPPAYPDKAHVSNGCHVSTITYLARFQAEFPRERGEFLVVQMLNADGVRRSHTISLISWQGRTWCRDEYFGVFALDCADASRPTGPRLVAKAQAALEKHVKHLIRTTGMTLRPAPSAKMSPEQRIMEVAVVAGMVPFSTTIFWVRSGNSKLPLAFFRPANGRVAVYDPMHGTSLAECAVPDDAKIVAAVATRLGYRVDSVRADATGSPGKLVAANMQATGGAQ